MLARARVWWISEQRLTLPGTTGKGPEELGSAFPIMPQKSRELLWVYSRLEVGRIWLGTLKPFTQTIFAYSNNCFAATV